MRLKFDNPFTEVLRQEKQRLLRLSSDELHSLAECETVVRTIGKRAVNVLIRRQPDVDNSWLFFIDGRRPWFNGCNSLATIYRDGFILKSDGSIVDFPPSRMEIKLKLGLLGFAAWGAVYCVYQFLHCLPDIITYFSYPSHRIFGIAASIAAALGLFAVRLFARAFYGVTEVAFGCVVLWQSFTTVSSNGSAKWPIVVAAIYLLVRGFDNLHEGVGSPLKKKSHPGNTTIPRAGTAN